jgi:hypothetical protein
MMPGMSIADESTVTHWPPRDRDDVEVRLRGRVVGTLTAGEGGVHLVDVVLDPSEVRVDDQGRVHVLQREDRVAILRDIPRDKPAPFRAHQPEGLVPRLPVDE